jgi:hypothetical protein
MQAHPHLPSSLRARVSLLGSVPKEERPRRGGDPAQLIVGSQMAQIHRQQAPPERGVAERSDHVEVTGAQVLHLAAVFVTNQLLDRCRGDDADGALLRHPMPDLPIAAMDRAPQGGLPARAEQVDPQGCQVTGYQARQSPAPQGSGRAARRQSESGRDSLTPKFHGLL